MSVGLAGGNRDDSIDVVSAVVRNGSCMERQVAWLTVAHTHMYALPGPALQLIESHSAELHARAVSAAAHAKFLSLLHESPSI